MRKVKNLLEKIILANLVIINIYTVVQKAISERNDHSCCEGHGTSLPVISNRNIVLVL